MLSIAAMSAGQEQYYTALAQEGYYLHGGEPKGQWFGGGAAHLGLDGDVNAGELSTLFRGFAPDGTPLVQNAGKENRQPGWDLTFSVPKTVSVLWSQADEQTRKTIEQCVNRAVEKTILDLEREAAACRVGRGGYGTVPAKLIVAAFPHSTSRALDPQYHVHCLVLNVGVCPDGRTRTLVSNPLYEQKMLYGAFFRAALARELQVQLGLEMERPLDKRGNPKGWFELKGIPEELVHKFSKRRQAIEKELGARGLESAAAAAFATLGTRDIKQLVPPRRELLNAWQVEGQKIGFDQTAARKLLGHAVQRDRAIEYRQALEVATQSISRSQSHFTERELLRKVLEESQTRGLEPAWVRKQVAHDLKHSEQFVSLGRHKGVIRYSTVETLAIERQLLEDVGKLHNADFRPLTSDRVERIIGCQLFPPNLSKGKKVLAQLGVLGSGIQLNQEQANALRYLTQGPGRVKVLSGFAGAGKTALLHATRLAYEAEGYRVIGTSLAGVAAQGLQKGTGIPSDTVRMRLMEMDRGFGDELAHHAKQLARAAIGKPTFRFDRITIDSKTVLVIDEAGMLGTSDFAQLTRKVADGGGVIIYAGDARQLPSIEAGGAFGSIGQRIGQAVLTQIQRQQDLWEREAVKALSRGGAREVLTGYAERGQLFVGSTREKASEQLLQDWSAKGGLERPDKHVIIAGTNVEVDYYNHLGQNARAEAGKLSLDHGLQVGDETFYPGDRVMLTQKSRRFKVENGSVGTILRTREAGRSADVDILLDGQKEAITIPVRQPSGQNYDGLRLGYAYTVHRLQGATVENSYIHLGGDMTDRELAYVQGSRHKQRILWYTDEHEAGIALTNLARSHRGGGPTLTARHGQDLEFSPLEKQMQKSHAQTLAHDVLEQTTERRGLDRQR